MAQIKLFDEINLFMSWITIFMAEIRRFMLKPQFSWAKSLFSWFKSIVSRVKSWFCDRLNLYTVYMYILLFLWLECIFSWLKSPFSGLQSLSCFQSQCFSGLNAYFHGSNPYFNGSNPLLSWPKCPHFRHLGIWGQQCSAWWSSPPSECMAAQPTPRRYDTLLVVRWDVV